MATNKPNKPVRKRRRSSWKTKLREKEKDLERMEKKVERMRARAERQKKRMKKDEEKLRRIQTQLEENRKQNWKTSHENKFADAIVDINLAIIEAEEAGDFLTADQLTQTLCELMAHCQDEEQQDDDDDDDDD